ncbi:hypothetical protein DFW101_1878 [Solidesulfovibrio carbinoliphilus subsp. oakridgensis]|uniref:Class I SAM-dependent methyltransferase n=1 Tax=Solidesulfovibrio carbinoliphilus subsp. oakridgensis TaxID=694327 RepID=G7Q4V8_9BACT|nr:hypothetical protein [Solidesulfovibrio carbinoliphilus]EHJ47885.1 hypothetical protein DFW101_1878 [Solidesulfovibrio carbinoliphilus subsp. oakridgensis]
MLIRYAPGRTGPGQCLRRAVRAVLSLPTVLRMAFDPCYPWINAGAVRWLRARLAPDMVGFEWGSGRSTAFAARQVARLVTVEHKEKWRRRVLELLDREGIAGVECRFVPPGDGPGRPEARPAIWRQTGYVLEKPEFAAYADAILDFPSQSLDFVLIDGRARVACALNAFCRIKPGGFLVLDNSEWEKYAPIFAAAPGWERLDFENGVWRTSILRRPGGQDGRDG